MAKYNPATKAVERAKNPNDSEEEETPESDTISQMLENYEECKSYRSRPPTDVLERLPDHAEMQDGKLWIPDPETAYDYNRHKMSLTEKRRRILLTKLENPDVTNIEVADMVGCSDSLVSRTTTVFGFLLDDPYLIDAFVYKGQVPSDYFLVRKGDEEFAFPLREQAVEVGEQLWTDEFEVVRPEGNVIEHDDEPEDDELDDESEDETEDDESEDESSLSPEELEDSLKPSSVETTDTGLPLSGDSSDESEEFVVRKDETEFSFPEKEAAVEAGIDQFDGVFTIEYPDGTTTLYGSSREIDEKSDEQTDDSVVSLSVTLEEFQSLVRRADDELQLKLLRQLYEQ